MLVHCNDVAPILSISKGCRIAGRFALNNVSRLHHNFLEVLWRNIMLSDMGDDVRRPKEFEIRHKRTFNIGPSLPRHKLIQIQQDPRQHRPRLPRLDAPLLLHILLQPRRFRASRHTRKAKLEAVADAPRIVRRASLTMRSPRPLAISTNVGSLARCSACSGVLERLRRVQADLSVGGVEGRQQRMLALPPDECVHAAAIAVGTFAFGPGMLVLREGEDLRRLRRVDAGSADLAASASRSPRGRHRE